MKTNMLILALIATSLLVVKATNIVSCDEINPCGGSCGVEISGNLPIKYGDCEDASDPSNNYNNYPCDCNITGS